MKSRYIYPLIAALSFLLISCDEEKSKLNIESIVAPTVSVSQASVSSSDVAVQLSGSFSTTGSNVVISDCGFYYYPENSKESEQKVSAKLESATFSISLLLKDYGTTYRFRAFISNGVNEVSSGELSFKLLDFKDYVNIADPVIFSASGSSVTVKSTFSTADGVSVTEGGIIYGHSAQLIIDSIHSVADNLSSGINTVIKDLSIGMTYYFLPYIKDGNYIAYGNPVSYITHTVPSLSTVSVSSVDYFSATAGGYNIKSNGLDIISCGVVWSKTPNPTVENSSVKTVSASSGQDYTCQLTELDPGTTYYIRAFATNSDGTGYGEELSFTTVGLKKPTISTKDITSITASSASAGGEITDNGGAAVTARGVVWSTSSRPVVSLSTKTVDGSGSGAFSSQLTNLLPATTYYVRAYATNSVGTEYGDEKTFTTLAAAPVVTTTSATNITSTSAVMGGNVTSTGGAAVTERGVVWSTSQNPTVNDNKKTSGTGSGVFTVTVTDLQIATTYFARAYAVNSAGISYGDQIIFSTGAVQPVITTASVTSITESSASSGGNVTYDGGASVTARGIVWSKNQNPSLETASKTTNGSGKGEFTSVLSGLEPATTYYVRAYATNSVGTSYGEQLSFTTLVAKPSVTTADASDITSSSAVLGGNVTATGGVDITERGIVWSTSKNPTVDDNKKTASGSTGSFTITLSDLSVATTYYVRAYAVNSAGISYGDQVSFTTGKVIPSLITTTVTSITSTSAVSGGSITADGGASVTARGVVWSTDHNPTVSLSTKTSNGSGTGEFTSNITNLLPGTKYYVRAYATNSVGTAYGPEVEFTTDVLLPTVTTKSVSDVTSSGFCTGGSVTADGGASVTARGVVWSTAADPSVFLSTKTVDGTGTGSFVSTVSGLQPNTVYYVRAYATNSKGTSYGEQITVQTRPKGGTEGVDNEQYEW